MRWLALGKIYQSVLRKAITIAMVIQLYRVQSQPTPLPRQTHEKISRRELILDLNKSDRLLFDIIDDN
jgi:hypothetical protein